MTLILLPTSTATDDVHELDFAILDLTYPLLEDLERRCELAGQLKQQDLELSEVRWWNQSLDHYGYAIVQALLDEIRDSYAKDPERTLETVGALAIPRRPTAEPTRADCRELSISPNAPDGDCNVEWRCFSKFIDTPITTPPLRLSELRSLLRNQLKDQPDS